MKLFIQAAIWLNTNFVLGIFAASVSGQRAFMMIISTLLTGVAGALVHGVFLTKNYFGFRGPVSIAIVALVSLLAGLGAIGVVLVGLGSDHIGSELWFFARLLFIPCFLVSAIAYGVTKSEAAT